MGIPEVPYQGSQTDMRLFLLVWKLQEPHAATSKSLAWPLWALELGRPLFTDLQVLESSLDIPAQMSYACVSFRTSPIDLGYIQCRVASQQLPPRPIYVKR